MSTWPTSRASGTSITERLVGALTATWGAIQARHVDVPDVVLTLGSGTLGARRGELAELFVSGEGLRRGARAVLGTLLHEAAHGVASTRGIKDTSRQGRYHNRRFAELAAELGIVVAPDGARG